MHLKLTTGPAWLKISFSFSSVASYGIFPTTTEQANIRPKNVYFDFVLLSIETQPFVHIAMRLVKMTIGMNIE